MSQLKLINLEAGWRRALLFVPLGLVLAGSWAALRWSLGSSLAEFPRDAEFMRRAERLAPDDPRVHYALGVFARRSFADEELAKALRHYERATSLSPNDYRLWMELGRLREQLGDAEGSERALRRSLELAPHYVMPQWFLGNLLLRAGRYEEAFAELRLAAERDRELRPQIFTTIWSLFGGDVERVLAAVGASVEARTQLVEFLVKQKRLDEALQIWTRLNEREQQEQRATGEALRTALLEARRFRAALDVHRRLVRDGAPEVVAEQIGNGSFESDVGVAGKHPFAWDVRPVQGAQMGLDTRAPHAGSRSLRIAFDAPTTIPFSNVAQLVPVSARSRYRLQYFVRTENLKGASTLVTELLDNADSTRVLAASAPVTIGSGDWKQVTLDFTTTADTEAVLLRLVRPPCTEETCPIFGKIWYDDFTLQRLG